MICRRTACVALVCARWRPALAQPLPEPESELLEAWQALRQARGHFDGAPWRDDVDRWQGRKHVLMQTLAERLLQAQASAERVSQTLGQPDAELAPGQPAHVDAVARLAQRRRPDALALLPAPSDAGLWLYRWRGAHDQLGLLFERGRVVATGWLYELE